ncbi:MAG: di-heme oxidoredictase family protein [Methyloligellaceae bacterium]
MLIVLIAVDGGMATGTRTSVPRTWEQGEMFPGGQATSKNTTWNRNSFSHQSGNLGFDGELNFKLGNAIFRKLWVSSPASTKSSDGLGPLFNARSCQRCHLKDGRGHPPGGNWPEDNAISMLLRLSVPPQTEAQRQRLDSGRALTINEPTYGGQLQDLAVQGHDFEGRIHISYTETTVTLQGGERVRLRQPQYRIVDPGYGPLHADTMISPRIAPQMIGLGLLEAIPEADIRANEDPDDRNGDGISGRANQGWSIAENRPKLGRFGHKAGMVTLHQQAASAFAGDIGLSTKLLPGPSGDCMDRQIFCLNAPNGNAVKGPPVEVSEKLMGFVTFYTQNLAVPRRRVQNRDLILKGKALFHDIGCQSCHRPKFKTGDLADNPHLANQTIWPYTDLLLHDMGEGLADHRPEGRANGREWRTAPLWGIGLTPKVSGHSFYLHDGRARNLTEAILWHGGEAEAARNKFTDLPKSERYALIAFVESL